MRCKSLDLYDLFSCDPLEIGLLAECTLYTTLRVELI